MKFGKHLAALAATTIVGSFASVAMADALASAGRNDRVYDQNGIQVVQSALTSVGSATNPYIQYSENNGFGNSRFGASYSLSSYAGSWGAPVAYAAQSTSVNASIFDSSFTPFQQGIYAWTDNNAGTATITDYVYSFGYKVAGKESPGGDYNGSYYLSSVSKQLFNKSATFYVYGIPVFVSATLNGQASHIIYGHFWRDGIEGYMGPMASLQVTAAGGVGSQSYAGTGVRLKDLSLINISLGHNAKARYVNRLVNGTCQADLALQSRLNLLLRTLSGRIEIFATLWPFGTVSDDIAKWDGIYKQYPLVNWSLNAPSYSTSCIYPPAAPQFQGIIVG